MKTYLVLIKKNIKAQLEYSVSTYLLIAGQFVAQFTFIVSFILLFQSFGALDGYTFHQVLLVYAMVNVAYTLAEMIAKGINHLPVLIRDGSLDVFFLRPQSILLQVLGSEIEFSRIGRLVQSLVILVYALYAVSIQWSLVRLLLIFAIPAAGFILFISLYLFVASIAFVSIYTIDLTILLRGSGSDILHYPVDVLNNGVRFVLTYLIPFGFVNYYPVQYLYGDTQNPLAVLSIFLVLPWFLVACWYWSRSLKKYESTGS